MRGPPISRSPPDRERAGGRRVHGLDLPGGARRREPAALPDSALRSTVGAAEAGQCSRIGAAAARAGGMRRVTRLPEPQTSSRFRSTVAVTFPRRALTARHARRRRRGPSPLARLHRHVPVRDHCPGLPGRRDRRQSPRRDHRPHRQRLAYRDLDRLFDRQATCEAIAEHLATWFTRSARPANDAWLVAITVTTASGTHGGAPSMSGNRQARLGN